MKFKQQAKYSKITEKYPSWITGSTKIMLCQTCWKFQKIFFSKNFLWEGKWSIFELFRKILCIKNVNFKIKLFSRDLTKPAIQRWWEAWCSVGYQVTSYKPEPSTFIALVGPTSQHNVSTSALIGPKIPQTSLLGWQCASHVLWKEAVSSLITVGNAW
jgi:hypothetical protein